MKRHGKYAYQKGCRCAVCVAENSSRCALYHIERKRLLSIPDRHPASEIAAHIDSLMAAGMSADDIHQASQVALSTVNRIRHAGPGRLVQDGTARAILAVRPRRAVSGIGLTRRLRALAALGWTAPQVAAVAGLQADTIKRHRNRVHETPKARAVAAILRAYDELAMSQPRPRDRWEKAVTTATRNAATRNGWAVPLAWDDDAIDNPAATPFVDKADRSSHVIEDVEWLLDLNPLWTAEQLAERLGMSRSGIQNAIGRAGRDDLAATLRRNVEVAA